jgi:lipopolysaccharide export system protein LptA
MIKSSPRLYTPVFLGLTLSSLQIFAAPPTITQAQVAEMNADAVSKAPAASAAQASTKTRLESDLAASATASKDVAEFLVQADLPVPPANAEPPLGKPLEVSPGPNDTVINSTGGMYFDADEGVLVYLKNVTVKDPRYDLTGADELKIFFSKKPVEQEPMAKPGANVPEKAENPSRTEVGDDLGARFGDVERIVATGAVRLDQRAVEGKEPIKASGRIFTYNLKEDRILLSGGFPWFTQGTTYMRAMEPNLTLQLFPKTGSFVTEGNWQMGGDLEQKKKDANPDSKKKDPR